MKKIKESLRWFLLGFVPTLCVFGLIAGFFFAWMNTRSALQPEQPALVLREEEPGVISLSAFGSESRAVIPEWGGFFSRYPALMPHSLRLAAWALDEAEKNSPWRKNILPASSQNNTGEIIARQ